MTNEQNELSRSRQVIFNNLMRVPHRQYAPIVSDLRAALANDPDFIARACVHFAAGGSNIRDLVDCAIITLLQADPGFPEYREAGRCLLLGRDVYTIEPKDMQIAGLPPFRIFRVDEYIRKDKNGKSPRLMAGIMDDYTKYLEADHLLFDGVAIRNRKALKQIYKHYHIAPNPRSQAILFDDKPPADSKLAILKQIANESDPRVQARLVIENKIPYTVATSVLPKITPVVGVALIDVMSPTEALNSRAWVERSGLLEIPEVKDAYLAKVSKATASAASAQYRKSAQGADASVQAAVNQAAEKAVAKQQRISRDTLLLIDRSGSMQSAINTAIRFGERVAPLCDGALMTILFNDFAQVLRPADNSFSAWQAAFRGIRVGGSTSPSAGFNAALAAGFMPEQVVVITDGGENSGRNLSEVMARYRDQTGYDPNVVVMRVPGDSPDVMTARLQQAGIHVDKFETDGSDYYIYDQVASLLAGGKAASIVESILNTALPYRVK